MNALSCLLLLPSLVAVEPGTHAVYLTLTAKANTPPPLERVEVLYGPLETVNKTPCQWWQLAGYVGQERRFAARGLSSRVPLDIERSATFEIMRYQIDHRGRTEYRNRHTGRALLPEFRSFVDDFLPHAAQFTGRTEGVPNTARYLGHVLRLERVGHGVAWKPWDDAKVLDLDRELLVGTGRNFKDLEGHRLPPDKNYEYIPFVEADYREMIGAGVNLFTIAPNQRAFVEREPVFYLMGLGSKADIDYPADLYHGNYKGTSMFMDEPTILTIGDKNIHTILWNFSDAATLIQERVRGEYDSDTNGAFQLDGQLRRMGFNLGSMRLELYDFPTWETIYETAYYQMRGGANGIVHEGRYQLAEFDKNFARFTGVAKAHSADDLLRYHYAFLRGGTRPFGKYWGTAIYGQCDPAIAPAALTTAYDMGARYLWFWTSDHGHHVPYPEQLALVRQLTAHAQAHPRGSIEGPPKTLDTAIVIPYNLFISFENLWWVRVMDPAGKNDASRQYRAFMKSALSEIQGCLDRSEDFDVVVDEGKPIIGYKKIVRIAADGAK
ncbi:MAG: hypothetical protein ACYC35_25565 [Pirellulales bacterium]